MSTLRLPFFFFSSDEILFIRRSHFISLSGPPSLPLLGNTYLGIRQNPNTIYKLAIKYQKKYGSVARVHGGTKVLIFLTHPRDIEVILGSSVHLNKSVEYR